jgi:zinc protease
MKILKAAVKPAVGLLVFWSTSCSTISLNKETVTPFVGAFNVKEYQLSNGLKVLIVEDHRSPTFAYQTWFNVGSRDEIPGQTGLAHLFEHMMFKATKNFKKDDFQKMLEKEGVSGLNAFTGHDYTAYIQELPSHAFDLIAKLESDRMANLIVDDAAFKTETEVVQNERRFRNENSPDGMMYQEIFGTAFSQHSYKWPIIGYEQDLKNMTSEYARKFYKNFYTVNHATIIIVGDVKPGEAIETIKKYYGSYQPQDLPPQSITAEPQQIAPKRKQLSFNIQVEKLMVGYHIPEFRHTDAPAIEVLKEALSGGNSSRLYRALVDTGVSSSVGAFGVDSKDPSLLVFIANMQAKKKATQAENIILKEVSKIANKSISDDEIIRAKNRIAFAFYSELASAGAKARFIGQVESIAGSFKAGLEHMERIKSITPSQVQAAAIKYLDPKNRTVITGVPK